MNLGLIVAAGRGHRLGGAIPKQYRDLDEVPIIRRTAAALLRHPKIDAVQVLIHPSDRQLYTAATDGMDLLSPLIGGSSRQESVRLGLEGISGLEPEKVLIHDGVRPFVEQETVTAVLDALDRVPAAIAAVPVQDTLKRSDQNRVVGTVSRNGLWRAQTPQGFRYQDILAAHRRAYTEDPLGAELTDDAMLAERYGIDIELVTGTDDNFKITTEVDLVRAEAILQRGRRETHTGWGFDSQSIYPGGAVVICGIPAPFSDGASAAGQGDVALNAITSAVLGTVGGIRKEQQRMGVLGRRLSNSENLIRDALSVVAMAGGRVEHIDLTLICSRPEVMARHNEMVHRTAMLLSAPQRRISIKHLEPTEFSPMFRPNALAAQCLATINYPADLLD